MGELGKALGRKIEPSPDSNNNNHNPPQLFRLSVLEAALVLTA